MEYEKMEKDKDLWITGTNKGQDLFNYIKDTVSISLYKEKMHFIFKKFYDEKKGKYKTSSIGKLFTGIYLYSMNPTTDIKYIEKQIDNFTESEHDFLGFLIDNLITAMQMRLKKKKSGENGGAPEGNDNAKKKIDNDNAETTENKVIDNANIDATTQKITNATTLNNLLRDASKYYNNTVIELGEKQIKKDFNNGKYYTLYEIKNILDITKETFNKL